MPCAEPPQPIPSTTRNYADVAAGREAAEGADFVYVREGQSHGPLAPYHGGPYRVLEQGTKTVRLQMEEQEDWVALELTKALVLPAAPRTRGRPKRAAAAEDST